MPLTAPQLEQAWQFWVKHRNADKAKPAPTKYTKQEIRDGITAATTWADANQASFIAALNGTAFAGGNSVAEDKIRLLLAYMQARFDLDLGV